MNASASNLVFYDTETTGINIDFDQIIQFSAILTDSNFHEIDRLDVRCRRLPWIIPSPGAMIVTKIGPEKIDDTTLPLFPEMIEMIRAKLKAWSPAIFLGYNSFRFDEPLLQRALWQCLYDPYVTVTGGNGRGDVLQLVMAVARIAPHAIAVPHIASGRPSFKLDLLAPMNGYSGRNAHDALDDALAVVHLSKKIASRSPKMWAYFLRSTSKKCVEDLFSHRNTLFFAQISQSKKFGWWGLPLYFGNPGRSSVLVVNLDGAWERFFSGGGSTTNNATATFDFRWVKPNMAPIVFQASEALDSFGLRPGKHELRAANLLEAPDRVAQLTSYVEEQPRHVREKHAVEQKIYDGFPSKGDQETMEQFHRLDWSERFLLIRKFEDRRFQQLAQRLIYLTCPDMFSETERTRFRKAIAERLLGAQADPLLWRTISSARKELEEIQLPPSLSIKIEELRTWLDNIERIWLD